MEWDKEGEERFVMCLEVYYIELCRFYLRVNIIRSVLNAN